MGGSTKRLIGDVLTFGLAEPFYYQPKSAAEKQASIQRKANEQAEIQQKREAGATPTATNQGDTITDTLRKKSALKRSILTRTAQKLGD